MGADRIIMKQGSHDYMKVPDGMCQGNDAVSLEEDDTEHVNSTAQLQLSNARPIGLKVKIRYYVYSKEIKLLF